MSRPRPPRTLLLALLAALAAPSSARGQGEAAEVHIFGNEVLAEEVYHWVLDRAFTRASRRPRASPEEARFVEKTLTAFLHGTGYVLASVRAEVEGDRLRVRVDEGRLDKVIFSGESAFNTIRLRFALDLPGLVFNRSLLERKLDRLILTTDVVSARYEVVPVQPVDHTGIQLRDPALLEALPILAPGQPHELRVYLERRGWTAGTDIGLSYRPPDGLGIRAGYRDPRLFFEDDLLDAEIELAARLVEAIGAPGNRVGLSRAGVGVEWFTPPFFGRWVRSSFSARGEVVGRRRRDLDLRGYFFAPLAAALNVQVSPMQGLDLRLGGGFEQRYLFAMEAFDDGPPPSVGLDGLRQSRPFVELRGHWVPRPTELRRDRRGHLELGLRHYTRGPDEGLRPINRFFFSWDAVVLVGWDELWFNARSTVLTGDVPFFDEVAMGDGYLRAAFGAEIFMRKVAAAGLEYRISLHRDVLKLGLFSDTAVFEDLDGARNPAGVRVVNNTGVGLHLLLLDAFQVSNYLGVGLTSDRRFDVGFGLQVQQAF